MITLLIEFLFFNESNAKFKKKNRMASISIIIKFFSFQNYISALIISLTPIYLKIEVKMHQLLKSNKKKNPMTSEIVSERYRS